MTDDFPGGLELFAAMVIPAGDHAFLSETLKMFVDHSYDPAMEISTCKNLRCGDL